MALPDFYDEGAVSKRGDTRARVLKKRLGQRQELLGGAPENNPARNDSKAVTKRKLVNSLNT